MEKQSVCSGAGGGQKGKSHAKRPKAILGGRLKVGWGAQLDREGEKGGDVWRRVGEERKGFYV